MALIKFSSVVGDARGSIGGIVYSRSRAGATARSRTVPVNPITARRTNVRQYFGQFAQWWANYLTEAQRTSWNEYAAVIPKVNALGDQYYTSGFNMAVGNMSALQQAGGSPSGGAPTSLTAGNPINESIFTSLIVDPGVSAPSLSTSSTIDPTAEAGEVLYIGISAPQSPGRTRPVGGYTRIYADTIAGALNTSFNLSGPAATLQEGQVLFVRTYRATADARVGQERIDRIIATTI